MKVLHITPNTEGYEEVTLIANNVNRKNNLAVIEKDGQQFWTGGFLLQNTKIVKTFLEGFPPEKQYGAIKKLREVPFFKSYLEE